MPREMTPTDTKLCALESCRKPFTRSKHQRPAIWATRKYCSRRCSCQTSRCRATDASREARVLQIEAAVVNDDTDETRVVLPDWDAVLAAFNGVRFYDEPRAWAAQRGATRLDAGATYIPQVSVASQL